MQKSFSYVFDQIFQQQRATDKSHCQLDSRSYFTNGIWSYRDLLLRLARFCKTLQEWQIKVATLWNRFGEDLPLSIQRAFRSDIMFVMFVQHMLNLI